MSNRVCYRHTLGTMTTDIDLRSGGESATEHLRQALEADDCQRKHFHIRQAMQLLVAKSA